MTKMIVFDLDGTLTESKMAIDGEMATLLDELAAKNLVAVTGGGSYKQFEKQLLANLAGNHLGNLLLLPTNGASFYRYKEGKWQMVYQHLMNPEEKDQIKAAFEKVFKELNYQNPENLYGPVLDDRGSQITFSALGQQAPLEDRQKWNKMSDRREEIKTLLERELPPFEIMIAGVTSIDVVKKGFDKYTAIMEMMKVFSLTKEETVYIGDALYEGGNDYVVVKSGIRIIKVTGPEETKKIIRNSFLNRVFPDTPEAF